MASKRTKSQPAGELGRFAQQYARKAHKPWDPNDRNVTKLAIGQIVELCSISTNAQQTEEATPNDVNQNL